MAESPSPEQRRAHAPGFIFHGMTIDEQNAAARGFMAGHAANGNGKRRARTGTPHRSRNGTAVPPPTPPVETVRLADVQKADVQWLWHGYIPRGTLSLLDGDPGLGKSFITLDIAARVTRGWAMPPASGMANSAEPANVLILNAEDDPARTIRPRLESMGADVNRVHLLNEIGAGNDAVPVTFPGHLQALEASIVRLSAAFVIVDPLMAFLSGAVDSHKDSDVRRVLAQVKRIAERTQAAILVVRHLNKMATVSEAMYRGGGSIGIIGAARSALLVAKHPVTPCVRVLARVKGNLCEEPPALAYAIEKVDGGAAVGWLGEADLTANDLLSKQGTGKPRGEAIVEAERFLREELANGPVAAAELLDRAAEREIAEITLRRAKDRLGVRVRKRGVRAGWVWELSGVSPDDGRTPFDDG